MIIFARVAFYKKSRYIFYGVMIRSTAIESDRSRYQFFAFFCSLSSSTQRRVCWDLAGRKNKSETHNLFEEIALFSFGGGPRDPRDIVWKELACRFQKISLLYYCSFSFDERSSIAGELKLLLRSYSVMRCNRASKAAHKTVLTQTTFRSSARAKSSTIKLDDIYIEMRLYRT